MNLNERVSQIIEYSKLTASEFADEIDVQRSNISHITSGRNKPSLDFLIKIKSRFPELQWDWIITGEGEMLKTIPKETPVSKPTGVPDLFSIINDENFGYTESEDRVSKLAPSESVIPEQDTKRKDLGDSQRLAPAISEFESQTFEKEQVGIKRIVWFYENGKFESFEP